MIVTERKSIFIKKRLETGSASFPYNVNVGFIPDELRIVQVLYIPYLGDAGPPVVDPDADGVYSVSMESLGKLFLFDAGIEMANVNIRINTHGKSYQGTQTFTVRKVTDEPETDLQGELSFVIEFIKY